MKLKHKKIGLKIVLPKYVYGCNECKGEFSVSHSLSKMWEICNLCGCNSELTRKPSAVFISKKMDDLDTKMKPGEVVKSTIQDSKEDLRLEQERLSKREYKNE